MKYSHIPILLTMTLLIGWVVYLVLFPSEEKTTPYWDGVVRDKDTTYYISIKVVNNMYREYVITQNNVVVVDINHKHPTHELALKELKRKKWSWQIMNTK